MRSQRFRADLTIAYETDEAGWIRAHLPAVPSVITAGRSRDDAREKIIDALMEILAVEPEATDGADHERIRLDVSFHRSTDRELGRDR